MYLLNIILHEKEYKYLSSTPFLSFQPLAPSLSINQKCACCPIPSKKEHKKSIPTTCFCQLPPQQKNSSTEHGRPRPHLDAHHWRVRRWATNCKVLILAHFLKQIDQTATGWWLIQARSVEKSMRPSKLDHFFFPGIGVKIKNIWHHKPETISIFDWQFVTKSVNSNEGSSNTPQNCSYFGSIPKPGFIFFWIVKQLLLPSWQM